MQVINFASLFSILKLNMKKEIIKEKKRYDKQRNNYNRYQVVLGQGS